MKPHGFLHQGAVHQFVEPMIAPLGLEQIGLGGMPGQGVHQHSRQGNVPEAFDEILRAYTACSTVTTCHGCILHGT